MLLRSLRGRYLRILPIFILGLLAGATASGAQDVRPNIIVIIADDLGYGDVGCYGGRTVRTPNIDALAAQGVRFTSAYVTAAVCSPSRAGLMTGRYPQRHGYEFNTSGRDDVIGLALDETTLGDLLKSAGYATGLVGKWHLGKSPEHHPLSRGFDEFFGMTGGGSQYATPRTRDIVTFPKGYGVPETRNAIFRGRDEVQEDVYLTDAFTREAVDFIRRHKDRPFFLYLSYSAPHTPLQAKAADVERNAHLESEAARVYAAMISSLDDGIGQVTALLEELGLAENTLVVFFSDNGGALYVEGANNSPLNGGKRYQYEGGLRIPFIMKWPAQFGSGVVYDRPVSTLDLYPTFAEAANAEKRPDRSRDGQDLARFITGQRLGSPHETLFWRAGANLAVRKGEWKLWLVNYAAPGSADTNHRLLPLIDYPVSSPYGQKVLLFDLSDDIGETTNVAEANPDVVLELRNILDGWAEGLVQPLWPSRRSTIFELDGTPLQLFF